MEHYENFKEELQIRTEYAEKVIRRWLPEGSRLCQNNGRGDELQHVRRRQTLKTDSSSGNFPDVWRG